MKITEVQSRVERFALSRPYTIQFRTIDAVENVVVELHTDQGAIGLGTGSPESFVTGETDAACQAALQPERLQFLVGRDVRDCRALVRELELQTAATPAARAAVDIALHDLFAQYMERPLVDCLGRAHQSLPTSITIGIGTIDEALAQVDEYRERGFRILKVKVGKSLEQDLARMHAIRERAGPDMGIRVDPNQGYDADDLQRFLRETDSLGVEFVEQPMPAATMAEQLRLLPEDVRRRVAADESLLTARDAVQLAAPEPACGVYNIKLMKCGGVQAALQIADVAQAAGIELMWGCMDESVISIAAALHAALASPATRYLDLDGSLDLARDIAGGGFVLEDGMLSTLDRPGLGVQLL